MSSGWVVGVGADARVDVGTGLESLDEAVGAGSGAGAGKGKGEGDCEGPAALQPNPCTPDGSGKGINTMKDERRLRK